jgi:predicted nucleic acid-binding protein
MVAERDITREWWAWASTRCELVTSVAVLDELEGGSKAETYLRMQLLKPLPVLGRTVEVRKTAGELVAHKVMPGYPSMDAMHLALAIHHECTTLVTWDRKHLANPNKATHISRLADRLGLRVPSIETPREHLRRYG